MKQLIIALILACALSTPALAESAKTLDERCDLSIKWAVTLIMSRQAGITHEEVHQDFVYAYYHGHLRGTTVEVRDYMLSIITIAFLHPIDTDEQVTQALLQVHNTCVTFYDGLNE